MTLPTPLGKVRGMSSLSVPTEEIVARLTALETHQRISRDAQAEILAEVRGLREDFRTHSKTIAEELGRVYRAIAPNGG